MSYTYERLIEDKSKFNNLLNAYSEAIKNNIISLRDYYTTVSTQRTINDFSILTGIKFVGGTTLGQAITNNMNTVNDCATACFQDTGCAGALYTDVSQTKTCQKYSSLPATGYLADASNDTIIYTHYGSTRAPGVVAGPTNTINYNIKNNLETELNTLTTSIGNNIRTVSTDNAWATAMTNLDSATERHTEFENAKKINKDAKSQLQNSGLDVIRTKTKYILFIAALLILLAIYVRDFNFSITVFIILFLMISVYGSIFLGAFLLVLIVLYLVYYAY
jgi:hypothetical protein